MRNPAPGPTVGPAGFSSPAVETRYTRHFSFIRDVLDEEPQNVDDVEIEAPARISHRGIFGGREECDGHNARADGIGTAHNCRAVPRGARVAGHEFSNSLLCRPNLAAWESGDGVANTHADTTAFCDVLSIVRTPGAVEIDFEIVRRRDRVGRVGMQGDDSAYVLWHFESGSTEPGHRVGCTS